jgi:hypothetical protein
MTLQAQSQPLPHMKKPKPASLKPKPKLYRVLLTASIGLAVIGLLAVGIGFFAQQASTLIIGMVLLTVAGALGILLLSMLFPGRR